jgi:hypothetical protein
MKITIEEGLRSVEERAAMLRYLLDNASLHSHEIPDPKVLSGLGTVMQEIEQTVERVRRGLGGEVLNLELRDKRG